MIELINLISKINIENKKLKDKISIKQIHIKIDGMMTDILNKKSKFKFNL